MAAFNFPNSPSTNDLHTENGVTYKWNGTVWKRQNASYTDATNLNVTGIATFANNVSIGGTLTYEDVKNVDSVGIVTARTGIHIDDSITHIGDTNTKIRFPGADTVSVETAGQQNVQVDGTRTLLKSPSGTNTTVRLQHQGNSGYGDIILDRTVNAFIIDNDPGNAGSNGTYFSVKTIGSERLRITSAGLVGINQTPSTAQLVVKNSDDANRNSIDVFNDNGNVSTSISQDSSGSGSFIQKNNSGTIKTFIKSYGDSYFTGGKIGIGINNPNRLLTLYGDTGIALQNSTTGTGNSNGTHIWVNDQNNGELLIQNREASDIEFYTSDTEKLRIGSGNTLHVGKRDGNNNSTHFGTSRVNIVGPDPIATSVSKAASYLAIGNNESELNGVYPITFGYTNNSNSHQPAYIAYKTTNAGSAECGDLLFGTRNVTTDSEPTERLRITSAGHTLFSGVTSNVDTRNVAGITVKSPGGISLKSFGANGSRNWRIRPDDLNGWADLDFSCAPTDGASDWPDAAADIVLALEGDTKDVIVKNGNLKIGVAGKGIDFSAQTQSSSTTDDEILDHYEKGKWTPVMKKNGVANATPDIYHGRYVRVGKKVWLSCYMRWNSGSNAQGTSGGWTLHGLPFSIQDDNPGTCRIYQFAPIGYFTIDSDGSIAYGHDSRWQCNNSTYFDLYTDISSSDLAWGSGSMQMSMTGTFMIHE